MTALLNDCGTVYYSTIPACVGGVNINAKLTPGTIYDVVITSPLGNKYTIDIIADTEGNLPVDVTIDPFAEIMFNPWAGMFSLQIFEQNKCLPVTFTVCGTEYTNISFDVESIKPVPTTYNLICHCD